MRVAVFTDNDFEKVHGVTTTLTALVSHAPPDVLPRIYTASSRGTEAPTYVALRSRPFPIPFYTEMSMYVPHPREYLRRVAAEQVDVLHLTTPGPMGLIPRPSRSREPSAPLHAAGGAGRGRRL